MKTKVTFKYDKKNNIWFLVMLFLAVVMYVTIDFHIGALVGYAGLYYLIKSLSIELDERYPWLWTLILFVLGAVLSVFCVQYLILEPENFSRTNDFMLFLNVLCALTVYLFVQLFTDNVA